MRAPGVCFTDFFDAGHCRSRRLLHNSDGIMLCARILGTDASAGTTPPGRLSPLGAGGDKPDGSLWRVERSGIPTLSPIPFSLISVLAWERQRTGGHSLNQTHWAGQLGWTAGCG